MQQIYSLLIVVAVYIDVNNIKQLFSHGNATIHSLLIVVGVYIDVNNIKVVLPWKCNNTFHSYCCWSIYRCQQYKTVHCSHENATIHSLFIVVGVYIDLNNIKVFSAPMEMQQWLSFSTDVELRNIAYCYQQ
jgi:hypothetical protein